MIVLLLQDLLHALALLGIENDADCPNSLSLIRCGNVQVLDLVMYFRVSDSCYALALAKHSQIIVDAALHYELILLRIKRLKVDKPVAKLSVLCSPTGLQTYRDIVHHDDLFALHAPLSV